MPRQPFLERFEQRVLVWDGAMGTQIHNLDLDIEQDYQGCENCTDILSLSCPEEIGAIHSGYLDAGADVVSTNTFGAAAHVLGEFDRADDARELSRKAAEIARFAADAGSSEDQPRYVAGSLGPGTKLITLGQIGFDELRDSYAIAAMGLIEGGVDVVLIETCQDLLQIKCAVQAVRQAERELGLNEGGVPIFVSVTIEQTGTMLVGSSIEAAIEALRPLPISGLGLNCATGPVEMMNHLRTLARLWDRPITVMPNAGLPVLDAGKTVYPLDPEGFVKAVKPMLDEGLVDAIGGCCGTSPAHIEKLRSLVDSRDKVARNPAEFVPACSSLYSSVEYRQDLSFLIIGERCNSSGSRKFKRLLEEEDWDGIVSLAREQVRDGSHVLDVNVDVAGRDNARDMHEVVSRIVQQVDAPLMLDSTNPKVILAGLKAAAGKCIINSANFEEGEEKFDELCVMAKDFGAGLVIGTIDEDVENAMARTAERKLSIAQRAIERAVSEHGLLVTDLFIDPLVLPVSTGMDSDRRSASELIEGTRRIHEAFPDVQLTCGLSNVSFGLNPAARVVINAVLLHELVQVGMTSAIVHASKITPLHKIDEVQKDAAMALLMDRRDESVGGTGLPAGIDDLTHDPLSHLIELFADEQVQSDSGSLAELTLEERLQKHIIDGEREGLEQSIDEALENYAPLEIINDHLLEGMKVVGELFGSGQMQLPFVLQSAELMKKSVAQLEPHMEKADVSSKGSIVLATVKGDVHDIGKNLVDILLSNNGFTVHNLGIKQPIDAILKAFDETKADAIGLSGLLVKSVNVMEENLEELNKEGIKVPVLLGGAALTRTYAEGHLTDVYAGNLHYAKDAFEGLDTMNAIVEGRSGKLLDAARERQSVRSATVAKHQAKIKETRSASTATLERSGVSRENEVPTPPFWGTRVIEEISLTDIFAYINPTALFSVQWQLKRGKTDKAEHERMLDEVARPKFEELKRACLNEPILQPRVVYGYFPCSSDGNELVVFDPEDHDREVNRFAFPRQASNKCLCISDFYRDLDECKALGRRDVLPMMCVTMGERISEHTRALFEANEYQDYLYWHGLGVEAAEGLAEIWHKRIRQELGFGHEDSSDIPQLFQQKYRGSRYSFGYPACPDMSSHTTMWELLDPTRIGCTLTENYQIDPEQSTCAIVSLHPEARYFNA
ncbi:MAG: methionine synthase [Phycisphaerales bacterium]|nr:methionine synthase [Phycisphaerales bacterium]